MSSPTLTVNIQTPSSLASNDSENTIVCKFCHRQFAKYTCPTCNAQYCSLPCFRSEAHSGCSETFYKKEIESGIKSEPTKSAQERSQMLELLKRFEEESAEDAEALEEEEDESDLSRRFASVDLDSESPDTIWSMLSSEERKRFMKAISDPSSELAQQLLASEVLRENLCEPWWDQDDLPDDPTITRHQEPAMMDIPEALLKPIPNRPLLVYNVTSICLVYAYIIRHLGLASFSSENSDEGDLETAFELLFRFLPFLIDRKSTLVYTDIEGVIADLCSRFTQNTLSPDLLPTLLGDSARLMSPSDIIEAPVEASVKSLTLSPNRRTLLVLSDLAHLVLRGVEKGWVPQQSKHVPHKLVFYGAHVATMPSSLLRAVAEALRARQRVMVSEAKAGGLDAMVPKSKQQIGRTTGRGDVEMIGAVDVLSE